MANSVHFDEGVIRVMGASREDYRAVRSVLGYNPLSECGPAEGERAVLVTTAHRGVFFGYAKDEVYGSTIHLRRGRNCVYWSADCKGFLGLAHSGPTDSCRIGPPADIELRDITCVAAATPAAVAAWEGQPWAS